jgi:membrane protein implicated in regulation of membrane protease activity
MTGDPHMLHVVKGFAVTMLAAVAAGTGVWSATGSLRAGLLTWLITSLVAIPFADRLVHRKEPAEERPWPKLEKLEE